MLKIIFIFIIILTVALHSLYIVYSIVSLLFFLATVGAIPCGRQQTNGQGQATAPTPFVLIYQFSK